MCPSEGGFDINSQADFPTPDEPIRRTLIVGRASSHSILTEYRGEAEGWER